MGDDAGASMEDDAPSWDGRRLEAHAAVSIQPTAKAQPVFGVASVASDTQVDKGARQVTLENLRIEKVQFPSAASQEAAYQRLLQQHIPPKIRTIELDRLETALAMREAQAKGESKPLKNDPPRLVFSTTPAILIHGLSQHRERLAAEPRRGLGQT